VYESLLSIKATTTAAAEAASSAMARRSTTSPTPTTASEPSTASATPSTIGEPATSTTTGKPTPSTASREAPATPASSPTSLLHTRALGCLGLGEEALQGEELVGADEDLVALFKGGSDDAFAGLHGEMKQVDGPKDLVDLADEREAIGELREVEHGGFNRQ